MSYIFKKYIFTKKKLPKGNIRAKTKGGLMWFYTYVWPTSVQNLT